MSEAFDPRQPADLAALYDALAPEERARLDAARAADPALAKALARWRGVRAAVRRELDAAVPEHDLLVLRTLADDDHALDSEEHARLDATRAGLEAALARHPGLDAHAGRLRADRDAFERAWDEGAGGVRERVRPPRAADRPLRRPGAPAPVLRWAWSVAAVAAFVALGASLALLVRRDAGFERIVAAEARTVELPDGSTVELAAGAEVLVPERGERSTRQARLRAGRALFQIIRSEEPFTVETPNAAVTVLGTTFAVAAGDVQTDVVLVSGVIALAPERAPERTVRLAPGEASRVRADAAPTPPAPADLDRALAWTGDWFFRAEPLARVAARLTAATGTPVSVAEGLEGEVVSGRFERAGGVEAALQELARAVDARVTRTPEGGFRLEPRGR